MNVRIDVRNIKLETERLILRPFEENDLNDFNTYAKVEGVGEMAGWPHHQSIEESKKILNMFMEEKKTFALY
ncbi:MAG: GNAT family N-acetyltransferase, partial [Anaeroplasmataceae bacterium]|nr:GNAT family N-acetyltransferase [Anaeroplasmataceae bacterium]